MPYTFGTQEPSEGVVYITITGKIGASSADELGRLLLPEVETDIYTDVIMDCRGIEYISSSGLQAFMRAIQARKRLGRPKIICRAVPHSMFMETLVSVGLTDHLTMRT